MTLRRENDVRGKITYRMLFLSCNFVSGFLCTQKPQKTSLFMNPDNKAHMTRQKHQKRFQVRRWCATGDIVLVM